MVVFNHFDPGFFAFSHKQQGTITYWLLLAFSIFCKFAVPIFFMISGALLLKKDEPISVLYKKRIYKIVMVLLASSLLYFLFEKYIIDNPDTRISYIYTENAEYHLWYLYSYIALLMSLPLLRSIAKDLSKSKIIYLTVVYVTIRYLIPLIELLLFNNTYNLNSRISGMFICADIFFLPLVGYYIENRQDKALSRNQLLSIWGVNLFTLILAMYATSLVNSASVAGAVNQTYINLFSSTNAITIYLTIKNIDFSKLSKRLKGIILHLSSCTFGIYLIHLVFMRLINTRPQVDYIYNLPTIVQIGVWILVSIVSLLISYILVAIIKKIPILNKYV